MNTHLRDLERLLELENTQESRGLAHLLGLA
jgi:hypothetical protein